MSEWQPIETAPKDGTTVLAVLDGCMTTISMYQAKQEWILEHDGGHDPRWPLKPTHWMPLPEPPE